MGYQESYVRLSKSEDFSKLLDLIYKLGLDFFSNNVFAEPVSVITLKKDINGTLAEMCKPDEKYSFKSGEKFIYFSGERQGQRSSKCMFLEHALPNTEIYFTECFPSLSIFDPDSGYAEIEDIDFSNRKDRYEI
jgi:hypothetical protein